MLDMISMLTLLNSGKEEEEEGEATTSTLKNFYTGSSFEEEGNDFEVKERDGVLFIGIFMIALLGMLLILVAVYFFRKMVAFDNFTNLYLCHQVICYKQKRREQIFRAKFNKPPVLERV